MTPMDGNMVEQVSASRFWTWGLSAWNLFVLSVSEWVLSGFLVFLVEED